MNYESTMTTAVSAVKGRANYGDVMDVHEDIAKTASTLLGKSLTMYDIAMIHHVTKLVRAKRDRKNPDHFIDGINYLAFAAQFSGATNVEQDIKDMAAKFAPPMPRADAVYASGMSTVPTVPVE